MGLRSADVTPQSHQACRKKCLHSSKGPDTLSWRLFVGWISFTPSQRLLFTRRRLIKSVNYSISERQWLSASYLRFMQMLACWFANALVQCSSIVRPHSAESTKRIHMRFSWESRWQGDLEAFGIADVIDTMSLQPEIHFLPSDNLVLSWRNQQHSPTLI